MFLNTELRQPPLKRRRLCSNTPLFQPHYTRTSTVHTLSHSVNTNHILPLEAHYAANETVTAFKSQLAEILELFPPFTQFIASQNDPDQSFRELYQVFMSCSVPTASYSPLSPQCIPQPQLSHLSANTVSYSSYPSCPMYHSSPPLISSPHGATTAANNILHRTHAQNSAMTPHSSTRQTHRRTRDPVIYQQHSPVVQMKEAIRVTPNNVHHSPLTAADVTDSNPLLTAAKEKMIKHAHRNMEIRCKKIIESLNETIANNAKYYSFNKHFTLNRVVQFKVIQSVTHHLRKWKGGNVPVVPKNDEHAFKLVRAHWNRQKAQLLGDILFCSVLQNTFKVVLQIMELSYKEQVVFYLTLFRGLLSERVQFEQSMPRPVLPNACFDKASVFKKLCENILHSFSRGAVRMIRIKTVKTLEVNGKNVSKYVKNGHRSQSLAMFYDNCLQHVQILIANASKETMQHSIQSHLNCIHDIEENYCEGSGLPLIEWKEIQLPHIMMSFMNKRYKGING